MGLSTRCKLRGRGRGYYVLLRHGIVVSDGREFLGRGLRRVRSRRGKDRLREHALRHAPFRDHAYVSRCWGRQPGYSGQKGGTWRSMVCDFIRLCRGNTGRGAHHDLELALQRSVGWPEAYDLGVVRSEIAAAEGAEWSD
jgi:hypothetical protein